MRVVVIGAGIVGLTTSWFLARQGAQVTLIDRNEQVARETSYANGGQLSYNYVAPLADPSVLPKLPQWLLKADSPLRFRPRLDINQWRWCYSFLKSCTHSKVRQTMGEMLDLSLRSRTLMDALLEEHPIDFRLKKTGKLVIYRSSADLSAARPGVEFQKSLGCEQRILSAAECLMLEPALGGVANVIKGGIYTPTESTGDCHVFSERLHELLVSMPNVTLLLGQEVRRLVRQDSKVVAVETAAGDIEADAFVVAGGLSSVALLKSVGVRLPLYGLRGYSLTADMPHGFTAPGLSVTDADKKIVYAPLGNHLRIAAMVDIGSPAGAINSARIHLLKRQVAEVFPRLDLRDAKIWSGVRPATANSKPIIDQVDGIPNLWLNVGHGALGFTLACSSAELVTDLMLGQKPKVMAEAFRLSSAA